MEYTDYKQQFEVTNRSYLELHFGSYSGKIHLKLLNKNMPFKMRHEFKTTEKIQERTSVSFIFLRVFQKETHCLKSLVQLNIPRLKDCSS